MAYILGVDVSHHNVDDRGGPIDWPAVTAAGYSFALVKASDGPDFHDPQLEPSIEGAKAAGLLVGAYHFLRPGFDAGYQAQSFLRALEPHGGLDFLDLRPAVDVEDPSDDPGAWLRIDGPTRVLKVQHWCDVLDGEAGAPSQIYTDPPWWAGTIGGGAFASHPLWAARYSQTEPDLAGTPWQTVSWAIWQHSQSGVVAGIGARVDLNYLKEGVDVFMPGKGGS